MRADHLLVQRALAPTRSAAQRLIESGGVRWHGPRGWAVPRKAGEDLPPDCRIEITDDAELRFVSRGGLKLDAAIARCRVAVDGKRCLDVGQGTGGFTDVLLQRGATQVAAIEVGRAQLAPGLARDARVHSFEGVNARDVAGSAFEAAFEPRCFDLAVADLSFISLTLVLPTIARYLAPAGQALLLVKPQFELQAADIGKRGIVKDALAHARVELRIRGACAAIGMPVHDYFESAIAGGDGNREFFVWAGAAAPHQGEAS